MKLSICIATFNRARFIGETLEAILPQLTPEVELVVVDGASTDGTGELMADFVRRYPATVYRREKENCGFDQDFDKAVNYARGAYCWLMSDDDILAPDAVAIVLERLADDPECVIVNAEIRTRDLSVVLKPNQLELAQDREFNEAQHECFFTAAATYLSFIGAVVIRRAAWMKRDRAAYFGTMFVHFGVLFQPPELGRAKIIARPLIRIRYGNALWTPRAFEIWIEKWPRLVWSLGHFSEESRAKITGRHPAQSLKILLWYRAIGAYRTAEFRTILAAGQPYHPLARLVALAPAQLANAAVAIYLLMRKGISDRVMLYDLLRAGCASAVTHWAAKRSGFPQERA